MGTCTQRHRNKNPKKIENGTLEGRHQTMRNLQYRHLVLPKKRPTKEENRKNRNPRVAFANQISQILKLNSSGNAILDVRLVLCLSSRPRCSKFALAACNRATRKPVASKIQPFFLNKCFSLFILLQNFVLFSFFLF